LIVWKEKMKLKLTNIKKTNHTPPQQHNETLQHP